MYRLRIYGEDELIHECCVEFETLEEAEEAKDNIWIEIIDEEEERWIG